MKIFALLLLCINLMAQDNYAVRVAHGQATESDLLEVLSGGLNYYPNIYRVTSVDLGYLLKEDAFDAPLDVYVYGGLAHFDEDGMNDDIYEVVAYIKLFYKFSILESKFRLGFAEGLSYTSGILQAEYIDAQADKEPTSHLLNYLDLSLDVDLGSFSQAEALQNTMLGFTIKHRSGIFGTFGGVHGGSNYLTVSLEKKF